MQLGIKGVSPLLTRLIALATLCVIVAPATSSAQIASPEQVACHQEATQRYIAGFSQVGPPREMADRFPIIVTAFQNDGTKYDEYYAECLRLNPTKKR